MAVTEQTPRNTSTAAAGATVFPYSFKIASSADLAVTVDGLLKTLTTDYTLSGVGSDSGGNVTFVTPLVGGEVVQLRRAMPLRRQTDYQNLGDLRASTINGDFDAVVMMLQQLKDQLDEAADPPPRTSVLIGADVVTNQAPISNAALATLPMLAGKVYRVRVTGSCRALSAGPYGASIRFYDGPGFIGTATGMAAWHPNNGTLHDIKGTFLDSTVLTGTAMVPALAASTTGATVGLSVDMIVRCTADGDLSFHFGSTSGSGLNAQLDAGTLIQSEEIRL